MNLKPNFQIAEPRDSHPSSSRRDALRNLHNAAAIQLKNAKKKPKKPWGWCDTSGRQIMIIVSYNFISWLVQL